MTVVHSGARTTPPRPQPPPRQRRVGGGIRAGLLLVSLAAAGAAAVNVAFEVGALDSIAAMTGGRGAGGEFREAGLLARATLMALNDANRTGNYAVLRALAAPAFQARHSADGLAEIFAGVRRAGLDLSAVASAAPTWQEPPDVDGDGYLRLRGRIEARAPVAFALAFAPVAQEWRLIEVTVSAAPVR